MKTLINRVRLLVAPVAITGMLAQVGCSSMTAREHPMFDGRTGEAVSWDELASRVHGAEAIFVGEQHDDGHGHAVQLAIYEDVAAAPGVSGLSMEMLERDEQAIVDSYLQDQIGLSDFIEQTGSTSWGRKGNWQRWYQPIIDEAREQGFPVVAANAPREYVRKAGKDGHAAMAELPEAERALFDIPVTIETADTYRVRFLEVMGAPTAPASTSQPADATTPTPTAQDPHAGMTYEQGLGMFGSQMVWDATMAQSMVSALDRGDVDRVVHLIGQFHIEFEGGTVLELRARRPGTRVLTISLQPKDVDELLEEDVGRADVVIYTGEKKR